MTILREDKKIGARLEMIERRLRLSWVDALGHHARDFMPDTRQAAETAYDKACASSCFALAAELRESADELMNEGRYNWADQEFRDTHERLMAQAAHLEAAGLVYGAPDDVSADQCPGCKVP